MSDTPRPYRYTVAGVDARLVRQIRVSALAHGMSEAELINLLFETYLKKYPISDIPVAQAWARTTRQEIQRVLDD